jgi:glycine/D-amino acid oxidase-like deaminating enzyme
MANPVGRRKVLAAAGAAWYIGTLPGCAAPDAAQIRLILPPPRASLDRVTRITVCTRPFRPQGPRLDVESIGNKTVIHNYGHGGSGWSLSWGSGRIAVGKAMGQGGRDLAVIGCGALGLTSALLAQRAGARVTLYAKELPPHVRSSLASGLWTPDSRICLEQHATPDVKAQWQDMCRTSFDAYQDLLGLAGAPVEFIDSYFVADDAASRRRLAAPAGGRPPFAELQRELVPDLLTDVVSFAPGSHNLGPHYLRRTSQMMFNIPAYTRLLLGDFLGNGGKFEVREFHSPAEFGELPQQTLINCTGFGARALFGDHSLVPVRGQLARLIPQPEISYGLFYHGVSFVPRRDGLVFQVVGDDDYYGYDDENTTPSHAEAALAVTTIAQLFG